MIDNQRNDSLLIAVGLLVILALAAYLRFVGLDWDQNHHLHPDERFLTQVSSAMHSVDSWKAYFDTNNSTLNPNNVGFGFFVYGDLPIIFTRYVAEQIDQTSYFTVYLVGRIISAVSDLLSVLVIFLAGKKLFNARVGLLSAAFYAFAALPIQLSHFFTVDAFTNLFVALSFLFIARILIKHNWLDYPLFGLMLGLAMSSKVSIFPLALILIVALVLRVAREINEKQEEHIDRIVQKVRASQEVDEPLPWWKRPTTRLVARAIGGLVIAGVVTVATFRVGQPYAFLPPNSNEPISVEELGLPLTILSRIGDPIGLRPNPAWLLQMDEVRRQVSGYADIPPNHQWGKRIPLVFPWINMVRVGLGWPLGVFCCLAFVWALWEIGRGQRGASALMLPVTWTALIFVWQGIGWVKTMRYFLPIYPFLLMLGAWAAVTIWDRIQGLLAERNAQRWHWAAILSAGLTGLVVASAFIWGFSVSRIYTRPVTRVEASYWMLENIPSDVTLSLETAEGPRLFQLGLPNNWPSREAQEDSVTEPAVKNTFVGQGLGQAFPFTLTDSGTLTGITLNHVLDAEDREDVETLEIVLTKDFAGNEVLTSGSITSDFNGENDPRGEAYEVKIDPVFLNANETYYLFISPAGPMLLSGSNLAVEGAWDDPIPLSIAPYNVWGAQYQGYELEMSWEDTVDKRDRMIYILNQSDYIAISSNRFYASMSRNPQRYPLTIRYYEALFSGELGFELIKDFTSRPNFGLIEFNDDDAEEAWTVYDHPRVFVFQKTANYDPARTAEILGEVDLDNVARVIAKDSKGRPEKIPLPRLGSVKGMNLVNPGTDYSIHNSIFAKFQPLAILLWWLLVLGIGMLAFPSLFALFHALPDRAYPLSRAFGLLFVAWLSWFAGSYSIPWGGFSVAAAMVVLGLLSLAFIWPRRSEFVEWLREHWRHIVLMEGMFAGLFLLFVLIRLGNPDLWHPAYGGEKPMDMAYFNAVLNSESFPPYDPWFAGGTINYYYFGFVVVGAPLKLLPIPMTLAYNLILPTLFAMTGLGAFSAAYNLISPWKDEPPPDEDKLPVRPSPTFWQTIRTWPKISLGEVIEALGRDVEYFNAKLTSSWKPYAAGAAALLLTALLGNLDQIRTVAWAFAELGSGTPMFPSTATPNLGDIFRGIAIYISEGTLLPVGLGEWYWNATRLIPVPLDSSGNLLEVGPITEFPFFTFLYADLHAHMIAMPVGLLAISWSVAQIRSAFSEKHSQGMVWLNVIAGALIIGALRAINTWDMPTYLVLAACALALAHFYRRQAEEALPALIVGAITAVLLGIFAYFFVIDPGSITPGEGTNFNLLAAGIAAMVGLLVGFAAGLVAFRPAKRDDERDNLYYWSTLGSVLFQVAVMTGGTVLFFLPYIQNYHLEYTSFIPWTGSKTPLWAYVDILGLFLYLIISWMVYESIRWGREGRLERSSILPMIVGLGAFGALIWLAATTGYPVALVALPLMVWAAALFLRPGQPAAKRIILGMLIAALALSLMVEIVVLQGDISRMNTVFKFYLQIWILMAITAAGALSWLWPVILRSPRAVRTPWNIVLGILVFLSALYPLLATRAKIADRWGPDAPKTLDGMAYMPYVERYENGEVFSLKPDYEALHWLQENVNGTPVVLEAHTIEYQWGSRVSIYTGFPSVIGWNWHQRQQRPTDSNEVWARVNAVLSAYNSTNIDATLRILDRYDVDLIMVGELERAYYEAEGLAKFEEMVKQGYLERIYEKDGTLIYQVVRS